MTEVQGQNAILVAGGWDEFGVLNNSEFMKLDTKEWQEINPGSPIASYVNIHQLRNDDAHLRIASQSFVGLDGKPRMVGGLACGKCNYP